jgi:hypothetical protein
MESESQISSRILTILRLFRGFSQSFEKMQGNTLNYTTTTAKEAEMGGTGKMRGDMENAYNDLIAKCIKVRPLEK